MRMILAATVVAALTLPASAQVSPETLAAAQELYTTTEMSDEAHVALYCGAAYTLVSQILASQGSPAEQTDPLAALANQLLAKAEELLIAEGVSDEDRTALGEAFTYVANHQVIEGAEEPEYTEEECSAAAAQ